MAHSARLLIVGPLPPPYHGVAVATQALCSVLEQHAVGFALVDTADRRGLGNIGRIDWSNITAALQHGARFVCALVRSAPRVVLVPISQNTPGFLRDCLFLIPARLTRKRIVLHLHGSDFRRFYDTSPAVLRWLIRWILSDTARIIVLGDNLRAIFAAIAPLDRVVVVRNGVDGSPYDGRRLREPGPATRGIQVAYLGSLMKAKGFIDVIQALPVVVETLPDARFVLAGELVYAAEKREAEQLLQDARLRNRVSLPGVVAGDAKTRLLLSSDIFVFPPRDPEGLPLVILEAMAAGLPVITTDRGAIRETVVDGVTGFIVPAGNSRAIAEKILVLAKDDVLRQSMGQAGQERFRKYYSLDRWGGEMVHLLTEVAGERP